MDLKRSTPWWATPLLTLVLLSLAGPPSATAALPTFELGAPSSSKARPSGANAGVLVRLDASLTTANRASGMPTTSSPGRNLVQATVGFETYGQDSAEPSYFLDAEVKLAGTPAGDPDARLTVAFGNQNGATCELNAAVSRFTEDYAGSTYELGGYNPEYFPTPSRPWDCVAVYLDDSVGGAPTTTYDALVGPLNQTRRSPDLKIEAITLLGKKQRNLKLVRGVPTRLWVDLENTGSVKTGPLRVRVSGKGIKSRGTKLDPIGSERGTSGGFQVKLTGRKKRTGLKVTVTDGSARASRTIRVTSVRPPRRARSGMWRSTDRSVSFAVRRGRIIGWIGQMTTRCGGFPDNFTYTTNTYDFPTVRIPRNGIVEARDSGPGYGVSLRMRIAGGRATQGSFVYNGPDRCFAQATFMARRVGR